MSTEETEGVELDREKIKMNWADTLRKIMEVYEMKMKRTVTTLLAAVMMMSVMTMSASAAGYDDSNTSYRNLDTGYNLPYTVQGMEIFYTYGVKNCWARTKLQTGMGPATGKAYVGMIPRKFGGFNAKQINATSTMKSADGYVQATATSTGKGNSADPNTTAYQHANTLMHSGTSNVYDGWRFDHRYKHK